MDISGKTADLQEALEYLNGFQFHGFRLGLERMDVILNVLGSPEKDYPALHVAGTNGKGSTCAIINSILTCAGYRTGFYSSPHLYRLNERFRTGSREIDNESLASMLLEIRGLIESGCEVSYFEYTTAVAMLWFSRIKVDIAVFETGLGGRLDATNVIDPEVSVITNIALEHQTYLGETIGEIAFEKAGIIKQGRPVVCGVPEGEALRVIAERSSRLKAPMKLSGRDFSFEMQGHEITWHGWDGTSVSGIVPALKGEHQAANTSLAIAAVKAMPHEKFRITHEDIRKGCRLAAWPGRGEIFTYMNRTILLDGAHNMNGVEALAGLLYSRTINRTGGRWDTLLWACSDEGGDKNFREMLEYLAERFSQIIITEPAGPRKPVPVEAWEREGLGAEYTVIKEWKDAWRATVENTPEHGMICVTGSLYLVGSIRAMLAVSTD